MPLIRQKMLLFSSSIRHTVILTMIEWIICSSELSFRLFYSFNRFLMVARLFRKA